MKRITFKTALNYLFITLLYSIIYIVLRERFNVEIFAFGLLISVVAIYVTNRFLISDSYIKLFPINIFKFLAYFVFLLFKIIQSGINAAKMTVINKAKMEFFTYTTDLKDDFAINLLANSITLTPGTVTINRDESSLLIMQLCPKTREFDLTDIKIFESKITKILHNEEK